MGGTSGPQWEGQGVLSERDEGSSVGGTRGPQWEGQAVLSGRDKGS